MLCGVGIGWCQIPQGFAHGGRDLESLTRRERLRELYGTLPGNTNVLGWLSVQTNMSQDALYSGSQHPFVFFNILPSTLNYDTFMLIQNIRRVATNWVTMGVKADGSVWSSYSDRLDTPQFHVNPLVDVNGDINQSAYRNSVNQLAAANSAAGFNIWGAHYLSFYDANSTDPNFQGGSDIPNFHVVVASGADAINTNNASHTGYYHANVSFSGF